MPTVAIIGGGPAGLAAAIQLRRLGVGRVTVLERELAAGGIPRHAHHQGFGARDLHRLLSGPAYARRYAELARRAGAQIRTGTMVTGWDADGSLQLTSPGGRESLRADATLLATGCRERPRAARLIPGSRPAGVMTTGTLQQLVDLNRAEVGSRAVIAGAEHVSFSAIATLARAGAGSACLTTEHERHQSLELFRIGAALRYRTSVLTRTRIAAIHGGRRLEAIELRDLSSGAVTALDCDTLVLSADWIPDHELAVEAGIALDPQTRGPAVDGSMRTSRPGVFAAGNVLHGAETADLAALEGRWAAGRIAAYLHDGFWPENRVPIVCRTPLGWVYPNVVATGDQVARTRAYSLRAESFLTRPKLVVTQGARVLWRGGARRLQPGRTNRIPADFASRVDPAGGALQIALA